MSTMCKSAIQIYKFTYFTAVPSTAMSDLRRKSEGGHASDVDVQSPAAAAENRS